MRLARILEVLSLSLLLSSGATLAFGQLSKPGASWTLRESQIWSPEFTPPQEVAVLRYLRESPAPEIAPPQRLPYFVRHLSSDNKTIAKDAAREVLLAGVTHISRLSDDDIKLLESYLTTKRAKGDYLVGFDHLTAGYLMATGHQGLSKLDQTLLSDSKANFGDVYGVMMALRYFWKLDEEKNPLTKARVLQSMRLLVDSPTLSDLALADLAKWKDWSVQGRLMENYGKGSFRIDYQKRSIIRYMARSIQGDSGPPADGAKDHVALGRKHLKTLERLDPKNYRAVMRFPIPKPRTPEPVANKQLKLGKFAPVASGLSGLYIQTRAIHNITFDPSGEAILAADGDGFVHWWSTGAGERLNMARVHAGWCFSIAFDPQKKFLATGGGDDCVRLWDREMQAPIQTFDAHNDDVHAVRYHPQGGQLYAAGDDAVIVAYDLKSGEVKRRFKGHAGPIPCLAINPSGTLLASGSRDDTIRIWDTTNGKLQATLRGHTDDVHSIAFSPSGKRLASASYDQSVRIWDAADGELIHTLQGHANWVFSLAYHPDGASLVSGDKDGRIIFWNANTGELQHVVKRQRVVSCLAFSPNGETLASSAPDATICLWNSKTKAFLKSMGGKQPR